MRRLPVSNVVRQGTWVVSRSLYRRCAAPNCQGMPSRSKVSAANAPSGWRAIGMPEIGPGAALAYTPVPIFTSLPSATSCLSARLTWAGLPNFTRSRRSTTSPLRAAIDRSRRSFTLSERTLAGLVERVARGVATA